MVPTPPGGGGGEGGFAAAAGVGCWFSSLLLVIVEDATAVLLLFLFFFCLPFELGLFKDFFELFCSHSICTFYHYIGLTQLCVFSQAF